MTQPPRNRLYARVRLGFGMMLGIVFVTAWIVAEQRYAQERFEKEMLNHQTFVEVGVKARRRYAPVGITLCPAEGSRLYRWTGCITLHRRPPSQPQPQDEH